MIILNIDGPYSVVSIYISEVAKLQISYHYDRKNPKKTIPNALLFLLHQILKMMTFLLRLTEISFHNNQENSTQCQLFSLKGYHLASKLIRHL